MCVPAKSDHMMSVNCATQKMKRNALAREMNANECVRVYVSFE